MTDLRTSLDDLAEAAFADDPVSTVDIDKARADGRRRVLASRLASVGGGLSVVAACALVANGLGGTVPAHPPTQSSNTVAPPGLTGTDPLIAIGTFGYLPDGYRTNSYSVEIDPSPNLAYNYMGPNSISTAPSQPTDSAAPSNGLMVSKWPKEPDFSSPYKTLTPTTVKGSTKAYIVADTTDTPNDLSLAWQDASGSWFALGGDYAIHGAQLTALLIKVAESMNTDGVAVPMPIHIEGLPKGLTLISADLSDPYETSRPDGMRAGLAYGSGGPLGQGGYFSISVMPSAGQSPLPAKQTGTYTVQPSPQSSSSGSTNVSQPPEGQGICKDSKGLRICVLDHVVAGADALASVGGADGLLDRISSLGTDKANWTTQVVNLAPVA